MYPDHGQEQFLARSFGCARVVFNDALAARKGLYKVEKKYLSSKNLMRGLTLAKTTPERAWLSEVSSTVLQQSLRDLETAYGNFFGSLKGKRRGRKVGLPRYKSRKDSRQSIRFVGPGFRVERINRSKALLRLPKMTPVRLNMDRPLPSVPSSVTVIREADGRYYASFVVDAPARMTAAATNSAVGIDLGLESLATMVTDSGSVAKVEHPRHLKTQLRKLARAQREHARRVKGSANREKSRVTVAALHRKVRESRLDYHHKLARKIVDENQVIGLETLSVSGLGRTRLAKSIHDAGWSILVGLIEEKALEAGRTVVRADRFFPSTRMCHSCGVIGEKKPLKVRHWKCGCGASHDRDINAAINLRNVAAGHAETKNVCGDHVRPPRKAVATVDEAETIQVRFAA